MNKREKLLKMLAEAREEEKALRAAVVDGETKEARADAQAALDKVIEKINDINDIIAELDEPADGGAGDGAGAPAAGEGARTLTKVTEQRGARGMDNKDAKIEERAKAFVKSGVLEISTEGAEARSVLVSSGDIATPTKVSGINDNMDVVSSIVDMVKVVDANGMGSDKVPYVVSNAAAGDTNESAAYSADDPEFDFVEITPEKKTTISYISEEVQAQSPVQYQQKTEASARFALRKKASAYIVEKINASTLVKEIAVTTATIDAGTLRKLVLSYGGDESVMGNAVLMLNHADLIAFGDVRGTSEKKAIYEITPDANNPNTGIIKEGGLSVKYTINNSLKALSTATKGSTKQRTMCYGHALNFQLDLFSKYTVKVSEDFKFNEGLLAIRGAVQLGGDVVVKDGFVSLTLAANS